MSKGTGAGPRKSRPAATGPRRSIGGGRPSTKRGSTKRASSPASRTRPRTR